jgi:ubiquinol-cytochrome c reductase cytochrome b subunit
VSNVFRVSVVVLFCGAWGWLTLSSVLRDRDDADYQHSEAILAQLSSRARELADGNGVPVEGAVGLLRNDPKTQGPQLFARHCANCHSHTDAEQNGIVAAEPSAPNLYGFASRAWIAGLLDPERIAGPDYFGRTQAAKGDMVGHVRDAFESTSTAAERAQVADRMDAIAAALAAEAQPSHHVKLDDDLKERIAEGVQLITANCTDCHRFHDEGELGSAPDLTEYGSREWLRGMIADPNQTRFYGDGRNDRMPAFQANPHDPAGNLLSNRELDLLINWLREE